MSELKPFDLERAKAGDPIALCTGKPLFFVGVLRNQLVGAEDEDGEIRAYYAHKLRMLPRKVKRWHVICKGGGFSDESAAYNCLRGYIERATIIEHEWEE